MSADVETESNSREEYAAKLTSEMARIGKVIEMPGYGASSAVPNAQVCYCSWIPADLITC